MYGIFCHGSRLRVEVERLLLSFHKNVSKQYRQPPKEWSPGIADGLVEGRQVSKGDFLLEIQPFAGDMVEQLNIQLQQLANKKQTVDDKVKNYQDYVQGFIEAGEFTVLAAEQMVAAAQAKYESKQKQVAAYKAKELQARLNYERQQSLFKSGLKPRKEIEKLKKEWDVTQADLESVDRDVTAAEKELFAKQNELKEKQRLAQTKIDKAKADLKQVEGELATVNKEISDVEIKLHEMDRLTISAPRDGTVFRLNVNEQGDAVKEGDALMVIVPETSQKAVGAVCRWQRHATGTGWTGSQTAIRGLASGSIRGLAIGSRGNIFWESRDGRCDR